MTIDWSASTPFFNDDHRAYADVVRQFTTNEIVPYVDDWERAGMVARDLYNKAAQIGLFGDGFEAEYGGHGQRDALMRLVIIVHRFTAFTIPMHFSTDNSSQLLFN